MKVETVLITKLNSSEMISKFVIEDVTSGLVF